MLPVNDNIEGIVMDMRKKFVICSLITLLFDLEAYIVAYSTPLIYMSVFQMCLFRYILVIPYYMVQILLLYYAEKLSSRILYVFPIYWGMEIWRLLFRTLAGMNLIHNGNGFLEFMYSRITMVFWAADCYVYHWFPDYHFPNYSTVILAEDILKFGVSVVVFVISCRYALKRYKSRKKDKNTSQSLQLYYFQKIKSIWEIDIVGKEDTDIFEKIRKRFIISGILIIVLNVIGIVLRQVRISYLSDFGVTLVVVLRYAIIISYYFIQMFFLYYGIKIGSRVLYFFPIYWGMEMWRLCFRNIVWENLIYKSTNFGDFMYKWVTPPFWGADWLPYLHVFTYNYYGFPMSIFGDDIIKLVVSVVAFIIACRYAIMQYRKGKAA